MDTLLHIGLSNAAVATVLAVAAAAVGWACRRPALAHGLWLLVLLKLVTPPIWPVPVGWLTGPEEVPASVEAPAPAVEPDEPAEIIWLPADADLDLLPDADPEPPPPAIAHPEAASPQPVPDWGARLAALPWKPTLVAAWLAGSACWLGLTAFRAWRFRRLLRHALPAPADLCQQVERLARRLGLDRAPKTLLIPGRVSPMLWAVCCRPRLLLPAELWARLPQDQRDTLLLHELAHLRRRDHWVRGLELLATGLFWWHPVVWWARRELREAEEQCCDAWVVWALPRSARSYALALVETVDFLSESRSALPVAASGIGQVRPLRRRLTMIMRGTTPRDLTWGGFLALLTAGALLLPILPIWAQDAPPADPKPEKRGDRRPQADKPDKARAAADREQAEAELRKAMAEVEKARAQLAQAEAALGAIKARLAGAGKRPEEQGKKLILLLQDGKEVRRIELPSGELPPEFLKRILPGEFGKKIELKIRPNDLRPDVAPHKKPGGADTERRLEELERRLKELLRDVEQLRGQMRPRDGSKK